MRGQASKGSAATSNRRYRAQEQRAGRASSIKIKRSYRMHGDALGEKAEGVARLWLQNVNGLGLWKPTDRNDKLIATKAFLRKWDVDLVGIVEHGSNMVRVPRERSLQEIFRSEVSHRTVACHNQHENVDRFQQGGTAVAAFDHLASSTTEADSDPTGLGRFCWLKVEGAQDNGTPHATRIVVAYQPCRTSSRAGKSVYQQQVRYFRQKGDRSCPRTLFKRDLLEKLREWRRQGDRIILMMDANQDMGKNSRFLHDLRSKAGLTDLVRRKTKRRGPATYFRSTTQIDAVFATADIDCSGARFLPFGFSGVGDHRGIVVDIPFQSLIGTQVHKIGTQVHKIVRPTARRLNTDIPGCRDAYNRNLREQLQAKGAPQMLEELYSKSRVLTDEQFDHKKEALDRARSQSMARAELKCRKLRLGAVDFSPSVNVWYKRMEVWELVRRLRRGGKVSTTTVRRRAKSAQVEHPLRATEEEADARHKECEARYLAEKCNAPELRRRFLRGLVEEAEAQGDSSRAKQVSQLLVKERSRRQWRDIALALGKQQAGSVSKVQKDTDNGTSEHCTKESVEEAIMTENTKRFLLTYSEHGSQFLRGQLLQDVGFLADAAGAQAILDGTYVPPADTDEYTRAFITEISRVAQLHRAGAIALDISREDFQRYWKGAKERTSSSMSGQHFGHYKSAAHCDELSEFHAMFTQVVSSRGRPLRRWSVGLSAMLLKKAGVYLVSKLRAILLMEADFNFQNKLYIGSRLMRRAETQGLIARDQFGSRNGHTSIEVAVMRRLFFDIARQRRHNSALASVDAQTCYDRVVHSVISLICQATGLPAGPIVVMLAAIQQMKFHLRTAYGDSKRFYTGTSSKPFMGLCQGNGGAPAGWALASSFMIALLAIRGRQCEIVSAITKASFMATVFMFVDDADHPAMAITPLESISSVTSRLQSQVDDWRGFLNVLGGALGPIKCFWQPISWQWQNGEASMARADQVAQEMYVTDPQGQRTQIAKLNPNESKEVMGVWQTADADMETQVEVLTAKAEDWAASLSNGYLHRRSVWLAFRSKLWSSVRYALPATNMTAEEASSILKAAMPKILPRLGLNRNIPFAFKYAPRKFQGLGLPHCRLEELIEQLRLFMMHYGTPTQLGRMITASEQDLIIEIGMGQHPLALPYSTYGHLATPCWLTSIWSKLDIAGVQLEFPHVAIPPLQRANDHYLMQLWTQSGEFTAKELRILNRCRRKKQVYSLACVMSGKGDRFRHGVFTRVGPRRDQSSKYLFPNEYPSTTDWSVWAAGLRWLMNARGHCRYHLGCWYADKLHQPDDWRYDPISDLLYGRINNTTSWKVYRSIQPYSFRRDRHFSFQSIGDRPPTASQLATVETQIGGWCVFEGSAEVAVSDQEPTAPTLLEALDKKLKEWGNEWVWSHLDVGEDIYWLREALERGTALLICDGSYKPKSSVSHGAAAWIVRDSATKKQIIGVLQSTGDDANAYRSELTGLYAVLAFVLAYCEVSGVTTGRLTLGCDNITGLRKAGTSDQRVAARVKHADVIRAIRRVRAELPITVETMHVYGHQDDHLSFDELSEEAQLNTICDDYAKRHLDWVVSTQAPTRLALPHESIVCTVAGTKCTGNVASPIRDEFGRRQMRQHLLKRGDFWSVEAFEAVDWEAIGKVLDNSPDLYAMWVTKHVSRFCGTNKQLHRMRERADSFSPHPECSDREIVEDSTHIMHCHAPVRAEARASSIAKIEGWLTKVQTEPQLLSAIVRYLRGNGVESFADASEHLPVLAIVAAEQDNIGWDNFICGRVTRQMRLYMHRHYLSLSTRRLAGSWTSGLVDHLLSMVHDQWLARNDFVHDAQDLGAKREEVLELREEIELEYFDGPHGLSEEFQHLFQDSFETTWHKPVHERRQWLVEVKAAREICRLEHQEPDCLATPTPEPAPDPEPPPRRQRRRPPNLSGRRRKRNAPSPED